MRGAGEILNTLLNVVTTGRSKFPNALREEFLGKQIREPLKAGGSEKLGIRQEKESVRKK